MSTVSDQSDRHIDQLFQALRDAKTEEEKRASLRAVARWFELRLAVLLARMAEVVDILT